MSRKKELWGVDEQRHLTGGQKHMWLKQNRELVLEYLVKHGRGAAMIKFGIAEWGTLDQLIEQETEANKPVTSWDVQQANIIARSAIESAQEAHAQIRKLRETYSTFVEQVGEDLTKKLFLPLLRLCVRLDNPIFDSLPDDLSIDTLFNSVCPDEALLPKGCDVVAEAENILGSGEADVMAETEAILEPEEQGDLEQQLHAAWRNLYDLYFEYCQKKEWEDALCMLQWMNELDCIRDFEEGEELRCSLMDWLDKAKKPDDLYICV